MEDRHPAGCDGLPRSANPDYGHDGCGLMSDFATNALLNEMDRSLGENN